jgi:hypothetical protein
MDEKVSWYCPECLSEGTVVIKHGDDIMIVAQKVEAAHKASARPDCPNNSSGMYRNIYTGKMATSQDGGRRRMPQSRCD